MHALLRVLKLTCTCSVQDTRAKQAIFLFPPRDQKCLLHSTTLTGQYSQEKKLLDAWVFVFWLFFFFNVE